MPSVNQGDIKYYFCVFGMTRPGIEPRSTEPLGEHSTHIPKVALQTKRYIINLSLSLSLYIYIYICVCVCVCVCECEYVYMCVCVCVCDL